MVRWARRRLPIIGNLKHLHMSPDAKFANAAISRYLTPVPMFERPFFRVNRRTRRCAVNGRTARLGMSLLLRLALGDSTDIERRTGMYLTILPLLARGPAHIWCCLSRSGRVLRRRDLCR
jgi:hypothetical protein